MVFRLLRRVRHAGLWLISCYRKRAATDTSGTKDTKPGNNISFLVGWLSAEDAGDFNRVNGQLVVRIDDLVVDNRR